MLPSKAKESAIWIPLQCRSIPRFKSIRVTYGKLTSASSEFQMPFNHPPYYFGMPNLGELFPICINVPALFDDHVLLGGDKHQRRARYVTKNSSASIPSTEVWSPAKQTCAAAANNTALCCFLMRYLFSGRLFKPNMSSGVLALTPT